MTDWIEHTTDTCPVDPETVVEVRWVGSGTAASRPLPAIYVAWKGGWVSHYRIIIPAKPPEPEMVKSDWIKFTMSNGRPARYRVTAIGPNGAVPPTDDAPEVTFKSDLFKDPEPDMPEPDLITLRLECLKLAVSHFSILDREQAADRLLHYVLNGSVDRA
jgi:hypothetical protein